MCSYDINFYFHRHLSTEDLAEIILELIDFINQHSYSNIELPVVGIHKRIIDPVLSRTLVIIINKERIDEYIDDETAKLLVDKLETIIQKKVSSRIPDADYFLVDISFLEEDIEIVDTFQSPKILN